MDNENSTNFEQLYHTLNQRRGEEFQKLDAAVSSIAQLHADLVELNIRPGIDHAAWERVSSGESMHLVFELWEYFRETDQMLKLGR